MKKQTTKPFRITTATGGELAEWLHNQYEEISKEVGWNTQKECKVGFNALPDKNKSVMLRLAQAIQIQIVKDLSLTAYKSGLEIKEW